MDTFFLSTFVTQILNSFSDIFKDKRTFENFKILTVGWILTPGRKTITRMIQSAGATYKKHHSCCYNFFSQAKWDIDLLSKLVAKVIINTFIPEQNPIYTAGDNTLYAQKV